MTASVVRTGLRILVVCDVVGATQQISFAQPLTSAVSSGEIVLDMIGHDPEWLESQAAVQSCWTRYEPDVLFLSRYASGAAEALIEQARVAGKPVVFHLDDDLLNVPERLGQSKFEYYNRPERLAALRGALDASDLVYASTATLAEALTQNGIRAPIFAGDIYCSMEAETLAPPLPASGPVIGYMATGGHGADLDIVVPAIARLMDDIPELRFETFGTIGAADSLAERFGSRVCLHRGVSPYDKFLDALRDLGWWIGIAPLEDTPFNRCKADTKWVEYTFAGLPVVASNLPVYQMACIPGAGFLVETEEEWYAALRSLVLSRQTRDSVVGRAQEHLRARYSRARLKAQLFGVIERAMNTSAVV